MTGAADRKERARIAANERWSRPGERERQSAALRAAYRRRMETLVDPDHVMGPTELDAAVANATKAAAARIRAAKTGGDAA